MISTGFKCEKCGQEFEASEEFYAKEHEKNCGVLYKFVCDKCGKVIEYSKDMYNDSYFNGEGCHCINLGRMGYGSRLDGCDVEFNLCDDCLVKLIQSFTWDGKEKVYNSGSSGYGSKEEWLKVNRNGVSWDDIKKQRESEE